MLDDGQRHTRKRFQEPLRRGLVGPLVLVLRVQTGQCDLILLKRPPQDKLRDREHADAERQQVREALDLIVELDKQRRDMHAALETVEDAFDTVFVAIAQHGIPQRQSRLSRIGDKGFPAESLAELGDVVFLADDVGYVVADAPDYPLLAARRAATPAHVLGFLLNLLFPCHAEQPVHPMLCEHEVNGLQERRFVGDLTFSPPSGGRQGRKFCLCMAQTCC